MLLSLGKFDVYQKVFLRTVLASPYKVQIWQEVLDTTDTSDFDKFVGDTDRTVPTKYSLPCLYDKIVNDQQREKYGMAETVNGAIFLAPVQLTKLFGDFHLNIKTTKISFEGRNQVINKITYMESLYKSVVSVRLDIEDDLKGGS